MPVVSSAGDLQPFESISFADSNPASTNGVAATLRLQIAFKNMPFWIEKARALKIILRGAFKKAIRLIDALHFKFCRLFQAFRKSLVLIRVVLLRCPAPSNFNLRKTRLCAYPPTAILLLRRSSLALALCFPSLFLSR